MRRANRLASQTSPYLLQHAHNPVDWYPWGEDAFAEARRRCVPIFLSVGYSTCYWCHVMERESFEDEATARVMNAGFVCIKVDREERPDVDDVYMAATQIYTGRGGWPMSVVLEPERLRPFWAGTYFPPEPRHGLPGFTQVLGAVSKAWREQREQVLQQAEELAGAVREHLGGDGPAARASIGRDQVAQGISSLLKSHDRVHGGFGGEGGPKFPQPVYLDLLLAFRRAASDEDARRAVDAALRLTLDRMACGGMFDQVGGGFHRYSVDGRWLVPHFEKMLYDNGQLAATYARAASVYADPFYARTARRTLDYVVREMTTPEGAFASAQDAEVNHREGQNYLWTREQFVAILGPDDGPWAANLYGLDAGPNFRDPHHPEDPASNVLFLASRPEELARHHGLSTEAFLDRLDSVNARLNDARRRRDQPHKDDKVLTGWNGLMIAGLAEGSRALDDDRYRDAAERAASFVLATMRLPGNALIRAYRAGTAHTDAVLEDYALLMHGLLALCRAGGVFVSRWRSAALDLLAAAEDRFADGSGGYYDTVADRSDLFIRPRSTYDGALPSGVSVMAGNLIDLHEITGDQRHLERAAACLDSISGALAQSPISTANSTLALLRLLVTPGGEARLRSRTADNPRAGRSAPASGDQPAPLEVYASSDRVAVKEGEPAGFVADIVIREGLHLVAADAGAAASGLTGLRFEVVGGSGVGVYADWPAGEPRRLAGEDEVRIYTGRITVPVLLERSGTWDGRPILVLRYQACTDTECLMPGAVELAVAIDRA